MAKGARTFSVLFVHRRISFSGRFTTCERYFPVTLTTRHTGQHRTVEMACSERGGGYWERLFTASRRDVPVQLCSSELIPVSGPRPFLRIVPSIRRTWRA